MIPNKKRCNEIIMIKRNVQCFLDHHWSETSKKHHCQHPWITPFLLQPCLAWALTIFHHTAISDNKFYQQGIKMLPLHLHIEWKEKRSHWWLKPSPIQDSNLEPLLFCPEFAYIITTLWKTRCTIQPFYFNKMCSRS